MAYSSEVKEFARQLYNDGVPYPEISKRVNKTFRKQKLKTSAKTVAKWAANKKNRWPELRDAMRMRKERDEARAAGTTLAGRLADLDKLIDNQIDDVENAPKGNMRTQVIYGLNALIKTRNELEPYKREDTAIDEVAGELLSVLESLPKLKPLLRKYRKGILDAVRKEMRKKGSRSVPSNGTRSFVAAQGAKGNK